MFHKFYNSDFLFRASCDRSVAFSTEDTSGFSLVTPESKWAYNYVQQVSRVTGKDLHYILWIYTGNEPTLDPGGSVAVVCK